MVRRAVLNVSSAIVRQLVRSGDVDKLEQIVLDGHGKRLLAEYSPDYKVRTFLRNIPNLMVSCRALRKSITDFPTTLRDDFLSGIVTRRRHANCLARTTHSVLPGDLSWI